MPKRNMNCPRKHDLTTVGTAHSVRLRIQARTSQAALVCLIALTVVRHNAVAEITDKPVTLTPGEGADWPGFLGPQRNGKSVERGLQATWPATGPPVVWQRPIGTGYAAPAISNGRVFHFARFADAARLTCFNAETGRNYGGANTRAITKTCWDTTTAREPRLLSRVRTFLLTAPKAYYNAFALPMERPCGASTR